MYLKLQVVMIKTDSQWNKEHSLKEELDFLYQKDIVDTNQEEQEKEKEKV